MIRFLRYNFCIFLAKKSSAEDLRNFIVFATCEHEVNVLLAEEVRGLAADCIRLAKAREGSIIYV